MYIPEKWNFPSKQAIAEFLQENSFATLVSPSLESSRLPIFFDAKKKILLGHFARSNPHWKEVENQQALAIFDGPHAYISPRWYADSPAVPTWNYASLHIKGTVSLQSTDEVMHSLNLLMAKFEPRLLKRRDIVTESFQQKLSKGVVGFSMKIEHIAAKAKLGQHRPVEDQQGVVRGLSEQSSLDAQALLALMTTWQLGLGK